MRAAVYRTQGSSAVLELTDIERPEPGPGQVRVRLRWSGVNPTDWKSRSGLTGRPPSGWQIPNQDGAGYIDAVGPGVEHTRIGEAVWVYLAAWGQPWGTAAEWTVLPEERAVPLPEGASLELGAMLGVPALTAYHALFSGGSPAGSSVLVAGGAGAVGHYAIELAHWAGAWVLSTVSGDEKARLAAAAGADAVVNYRSPSVLDEVRAFAPRFDRIIEVALGANLDLDLAVSGPGTTIVTYASEATDPVLPVRRCMNANVTLQFLLLYEIGGAALDAAVGGVSAAVAAGALSELPTHRFVLEEIAAAHDAVEGGAVGKVLIDVG